MKERKNRTFSKKRINSEQTYGNQLLCLLVYLQRRLEAELIACCSARLRLSSSSRDVQPAPLASSLMDPLCQSPFFFIDFGIP